MMKKHILIVLGIFLTTVFVVMWGGKTFASTKNTKIINPEKIEYNVPAYIRKEIKDNINSGHLQVDDEGQAKYKNLQVNGN